MPFFTPLRHKSGLVLFTSQPAPEPLIPRKLLLHCANAVANADMRTNVVSDMIYNVPQVLICQRQTCVMLCECKHQCDIIKVLNLIKIHNITRLKLFLCLFHDLKYFFSVIFTIGPALLLFLHKLIIFCNIRSPVFILNNYQLFAEL